MARVTGSGLLDHLPAVLREADAQGERFLERFVNAFQTVFDTVEGEIAALGDLYGLAPTPSLAAEARPGAVTLRLDSAAGLCGGDVLMLDPVAASRPGAGGGVEVVRVAAVPGEPPAPPSAVTLERALRLAHPKGTPLLVADPPRSASTLAVSVGPGARIVAVGDPGGLDARAGDVVRVGDGSDARFAQVVSIDGARLTITPVLEEAHRVGQPVACMPLAATATPPPVFASAGRAGPELLLRVPALAGEQVVELDTFTGLGRSAVLHLQDPDVPRVEFAVVDALPPEPDPTGPAVLRGGVRLARRLRFPHLAGTRVGVVGGVRARAALAGEAAAGAADLTVADPGALPLAPGDVLRVGADPTLEHAQVVAVADRTLSVTPPLTQAHRAGEPLAVLAPAGGGTALLAWLAGTIGLALRPTRGERWNRELLRRTGPIWPWRGTRAGLEGFLAAYLLGEAEVRVVDHPDPMQLGLVSTLGEDSYLCGAPPSLFWVELATAERESRLHHPLGLGELVQAAHQALDRERPAHTRYELRVQAHTMQLGVDAEREVGARVGDTTLLWDQPMAVEGGI
jgi:hypothetical protein